MNGNHHMSRSLMFSDNGCSHCKWHILLIKIDDGLPFTPFDDGLQAGDLVGGNIAKMVFQVQRLQFLPSVIRHLPRAGGCPVQSRVMHQDKYAVLGQPWVNFEESWCIF